MDYDDEIRRLRRISMITGGIGMLCGIGALAMVIATLAWGA